MPEMDIICQKWLDSVSFNEAAIFPNWNIHCGVVRKSKLNTHTSDQENYFVITWFLEGSGLFCEGNREFLIHDNTVLLRRPNRVWSLSLDTSHASHRYYLQIPSCMYELVRILYPQIDTMDCLFDFPYEKAIHKRFIELTQRMKDLSSHLLYMLLPDMISLIMDVISSSASEEELMLTKAKSMLERVADRTPLDEIARECGMPYSMFRKSFQKMYNISPGQYRIRFRINSAKQLLTEGYSVSVVAEMLNYPDIYSFSHQFSMVVGVPARDICSNPVNAVHAKE